MSKRFGLRIVKNLQLMRRLDIDTYILLIQYFSSSFQQYQKNKINKYFSLGLRLTIRKNTCFNGLIFQLL